MMAKFFLQCLFLIALLPLQVGGFEQRAGFLNDPCLEWEIAWDGAQDNPFDVVASAVFTHPSGEKRVTGMYYAGNGRWQFRFTGTKTGTWTFQTQGPGELGGKSGVVIIKESANGRHNGFITHFGNKWGWEGTGKAFIPQYVMGKDMQYFYDFKNNRVDEGKIEQDIKEFMHEHGFTGFHLRLDRAWFDIQENMDENRNPDVRTFAVVETILQKVYQHGGACHLWMWGKDKNKDGDGPRAIVGGPMSQADKRILRYIAARLAPLPGWSIGYGYDTENLWASPKELSQWKAFLESHAGWDHFIGARVGFDEKGLYGRYGKGI
ncbi:DUF5060 domain-containing protein, partial [bacterium]|nr:DUF5060 domain-containing protein [bacterium]